MADKQQKDRLTREIEEILDHDVDREPLQPIRVAKPTPPRKVSSGSSSFRVTPQGLVLAGLAMLVLAVVIRALTVPLVVIGLAALLAGYYLSMKGRTTPGGRIKSSRSESPITYWRGKRVDDDEKPHPRNGNIIDFPDASEERRGRGRRKK